MKAWRLFCHGGTQLTPPSRLITKEGGKRKTNLIPNGEVSLPKNNILPLWLDPL